MVLNRWRHRCVLAVVACDVGWINRLKTSLSVRPAGARAFYIESMADHVSDAELDAIAMAASPTDPFADGAVPFGQDVAYGADLLPEWYMPVPQMSAANRTPRRVFTVGMIIVALLLLNGVGLCVTYGLPEIAW